MAKTAQPSGSVRGPAGTAPGAVAMTVANGVATPQGAGAAGHHRLIIDLSITVNRASGSIDTQRMVHEITNTAAAAITVTYDSSYEVGRNTTRLITVQQGRTAYVTVVNRLGTHRILAVDDGGS